MLAIALSLSKLILAGAQGPGSQEAPPGLVLVDGGRTKVGTTVEEMKELVAQKEELRHVLVAQTPQHVVDVQAFYLMPTEVTNEQYAEYVTVTGAKPPRSWGSKALLAGQALFLEEQGKAKQQAKAEGNPFESRIFDPERWWEENWKSAQWEIPQAELAHPVVFVTYAEAQRYARWAGLRLMSEFEYQRAARGDSSRTYPWGDEWDDKRYCHSFHSGKDLTAPVGSYPEGAVKGIYDLAGNVWEWTSSPFDPYPGYEQLSFTVKKREFECLAPFDPNQRVTVSGSYQMDRIGLRLATRQNTDRSQSTSALGLRCAATPTPGQDAAQWIIDQDLNLQVLGTEAELQPARTATLRRWKSSPGTVKVPGYAVITGYEHVLVCPRSALRAASPSELATITTESGPLVLGLVDVPLPMKAPELDAGTYVVAWRGAGKLPEAKVARDQQSIAVAPQQPAPISLQDVPGFTAEKDCFVLYSVDGTPQVAFAAPPVTSEKVRPCGLKNEPFVPPDPKARDPQPQATPLDTLRFTLVIPSASSRGKAFVFDLPIQVALGAYAGW